MFIQKAVSFAREKKRLIREQIILRQLANHRLIFCINSGRAGSGHLAEILNTATNVYGFHEPYPQMTGEMLNLIEKFPYEDTISQRCHKAAAIRKVLLDLPKRAIYCETSHMFIKTFHDIMVTEFPNQVEVIALRRYLPRVLKSFIDLGYFSNRNKAWPKWMSSPNAVTAAIPCIAQDIELDQIDLSIAYLIDVEARLLRFKESYPKIPVYEVRIEDLNSTVFLTNFFKDLSIGIGEKTYQLVSRPHNTREEKKQYYSGTNLVCIDYCKKRINDYIQRAEEQGIEIPTTLALTPIV